jgi:hypothetical protein
LTPILRACYFLDTCCQTVTDHIGNVAFQQTLFADLAAQTVAAFHQVINHFGGLLNYVTQGNGIQALLG